MTPYELDILLHVRTRAGEYPNSGAPAYQSTIDKLIGLGVLKESVTVALRFAHELTLTEFGNAWLEAILRTPPPTLCYVGLDGVVTPLKSGGE